MSEKSPPGSWTVPAQPGRHPARTVAREMGPVAEKAFARAVEEDVARLLGGTVR